MVLLLKKGDDEKLAAQTSEQGVVGKKGGMEKGRVTGGQRSNNTAQEAGKRGKGCG